MADLFQDKIAIVTGGGSGMGRAVCEALARRGAKVTLCDLHRERADETASAISKAGGVASAVQLDTSDRLGVERLVNETAAQHGRLDYIFNNAGMNIFGDARDYTPEQWKRVIDVNLMGVLYGTTAAYAIMQKQGFGHVVNTASMVGLIGCPTAAPYAVTKYGVVGLTHTLRMEAHSLGVKFSVVCPGYVETRIWESEMIGVAREDIPKPLFKMISSERAAQCILKGVEKNKPFIVFPFHARLLWWIYRLHPRCILPVGYQVIADYRARKR
ncbi:MAG: SDR family oxidoreductase [Verrucomicrobiae bacterium]|nr:SDR family oxidoreductase [Verrucomicrobiae bacterium]